MVEECVAAPAEAAEGAQGQGDLRLLVAALAASVGEMREEANSAPMATP